MRYPRRHKRGATIRKVTIGGLACMGMFLVPTTAESKPYPKVFGTSVELPSKNFGKFPKWTDMLKRWDDSRAECASSTCSSKSWLPLLEKLKGEERLQQIKDVHLALNSRKYTLDINNWGMEDYWATPYQFLKKNGDCEDYAIAKYMALKKLGVPPEDMRVIALQDLNLNLGHAVLIVYDKSGPLLLDNQIKTVVQANTIRHYKPVYAINEQGWWLLR
ncbi:transglutaminase-like cysteine peptidase [Dongia sp.]|uniref:transglutaminase-like cysteine peptidase n=1 Tax=Dongia sp. TaxID=1977262 RepID=UPI0035AE30F2